jgi:hypothetical protein
MIDGKRLERDYSEPHNDHWFGRSKRYEKSVFVNNLILCRCIPSGLA